jgi:hypothetical protein
MNNLPSSLRTANPADGLALARQLAALSPSASSAPATMADCLKTSAASTSDELLVAVYFQAVAAANQGWRN